MKTVKLLLTEKVCIEDSTHCSYVCPYYSYGECGLFGKLSLIYTNGYIRLPKCKRAETRYTQEKKNKGVS